MCCLLRKPLLRAALTTKSTTALFQSTRSLSVRPFAMAPVGNESFTTYENVCIGGTFDSIHSGHKKLLKEAQSRCAKSMTVGVTSENMIKNKILWELIAPVEERIDNLTKYLKETKSSIEYKIVPITDPFGPAIVDESLQCIVVSQETIRGGHKINDIRKEENMKELDVVVIDLISERCKESEHEEDKVSSSSLRIRKLGTLLREPELKPHLPSRPYLIGFTGGIASGKSNIANELQRLGAGVVDCDRIAHKAYDKGTAAFEEIVRTFGPQVVGSDGLIDRRILGTIVFSDIEQLNKLNAIVWPLTKQLCAQEIERLSKEEKKEVIVVEAALLLEANWDQGVHQVWVSIIPENEAVARLKVRNSLDEKEAKKRIASQMNNYDRVVKANVVFSSLWEYNFTRKQVDKAWKMLHEEFLQKS